MALRQVFTHDDVSSSSEIYLVKDIITIDKLCNINRENAMQLKLNLRRTEQFYVIFIFNLPLSNTNPHIEAILPYSFTNP